MFGLTKKIQTDLTWSYASYAVLGVAGILLNLLIVFYYGPEYLGGFNIIYALYIVSSQVIGLGLWTSALKYVSEFREDRVVLPRIITTAILATLISVSIMGILFYLTTSLLTGFINSEYVKVGWPQVIPGLIFYSFNKTLMAIVNGLRNMKIYSLAQIFRYMGILSCFFILLLMDASAESLPMILVYPEIVLSGILLTTLSRTIRFSFVDFKYWILKHIHFAMKCLMSVAVSELNTRVDIIMLGIYLNDVSVGIYSIAAMCVEGVMMLFSPLRDNLNPLFVAYDRQKGRAALALFIKKIKWYVYGLMVFVISFAVILFPIVAQYFLPPDKAYVSLNLFYILFAGVFIVSGYLPVNMLLGQLGYPWQQSQFKLQMVFTNIGLNILMIPWLGLYGAAIATSLSYALSIMYLKWLAYKHAELLI